MSLLFAIGLVVILIICGAWICRSHIYNQIVLTKLKTLSQGRLLIKDENGQVLYDLKKDDTRFVSIQVKNVTAFFQTLLFHGEVGLGEMYMHGDWTSSDLERFVEFMILNYGKKEHKHRRLPFSENDHDNIKHHYDVGNDFYMSFLTDDLRAYTCGIFLNPTDDLDRAQKNKVNIIMKKLELEKGQRVLDIGCGWGSIANYMAKNGDVDVHGVTISNEQVKYIREHFPSMTVIQQNLFEIQTPPPSQLFDRAYCIGMIEHVRCPNYKRYFKKVSELLAPGGRFVLHTITFGKDSKSTCEHQNAVFVTKHIFPGGQIPERKWIIDAAEDFKLVHMEVFGGQHYAKTLKLWRESFMSKTSELIEMGYTNDSIRAYEYYMASCEAAFNLDRLNVTHFVFDKVETLEGVSNKFMN